MRLARGFTLVETLAVVLIMGLAACVTAGSLVGVSQQSRVAKAVQSVLDVDALARVEARRGGTVFIQFDRAQVTIGRNNDIIVRRSVDPTVSIGVVTAGAQSPIDRFAVDSTGRSIDYEVIVRSEHTVERWRIAGLTGWCEQFDVGDDPR